MTIRISLGNVGSGKTLSEVREIVTSRRKTYSNIHTSLNHQVDIDPSMIIKKELVNSKLNKKTGEQTAIYDLKLNVDYWKEIKEPINVSIDEAHSILNSRKSATKTNIILTDWMALIRRILGSNDGAQGELVLITQLPNRIDTIARDMATQIRYHTCHYKKDCLDCGLRWPESSDDPEKSWTCLRCRGYNIKAHSHVIEIWKFPNMKSYYAWELDDNNKSFYDHYFLKNATRYFPLYNTLQWDNMFGDYY